MRAEFICNKRTSCTECILYDKTKNEINRFFRPKAKAKILMKCADIAPFLKTILLLFLLYHIIYIKSIIYINILSVHI